MNRRPEHFKADPSLRGEFCGQESFDEYVDRVLECENKEGEELSKGLFDDWMATLHPETRTTELFYLSGWSDTERRQSRILEVQAHFFNAAVEQGFFPTRQTDN